MELKVFILAAIIFEVAVSVSVKNDLAQNTIGVQKTRNDELTGIVGGKNITIDKAKYVVSIITHDANYLLGTGVIINNRWVLTAAFILTIYDKSEIYIKAGSSQIYDKQGTKVNIKEIFTHPQYYDDLWDFDVALLKLQKPLHFSKTIGKIKSIASFSPDTGDEGVVSSFGMTSTNRVGGYLVQVSSKITVYEECLPYFKITHGFLREFSFCTIQDGAGPCNDDYGAPLVRKNVLLGIYSGGLACGQEKYPSVYVDMALCKEWVEYTIGANTEEGEVLEYDEELFDDEE